jgi:hypothetical protein
MRIRLSLGLVPFAVALTIAPAWAQTPDAIACPKEVADIATCYSAKLESGAYLLAAMPKSWNGNLIVFAHGGPGPIRRAPPQHG